MAAIVGDFIKAEDVFTGEALVKFYDFVRALEAMDKGAERSNDDLLNLVTSNGVNIIHPLLVHPKFSTDPVILANTNITDRRRVVVGAKGSVKFVSLAKEFLAQVNFDLSETGALNSAHLDMLADKSSTISACELGLGQY